MSKFSPHRIFAFTAIFLVGATLVVGLVLSGSPRVARELALDIQRVESLRSTQYLIDRYFEIEKKLPASLEVLGGADWPDRVSQWSDPETKIPYEYRPLSVAPDGNSAKYELCAVFKRLADEKSAQYLAPRYAYPYPNGEIIGEISWYHPAGRKCYTLSARQPEKLPHP